MATRSQPVTAGSSDLLLYVGWGQDIPSLPVNVWQEAKPDTDRQIRQRSLDKLLECPRGHRLLLTRNYARCVLSWPMSHSPAAGQQDRRLPIGGSTDCESGGMTVIAGGGPIGARGVTKRQMPATEADNRQDVEGIRFPSGPPPIAESGRL